METNTLPEIQLFPLSDTTDGLLRCFMSELFEPVEAGQIPHYLLVLKKHYPTLADALIDSIDRDTVIKSESDQLTVMHAVAALLFAVRGECILRLKAANVPEFNAPSDRFDAFFEAYSKRPGEYASVLDYLEDSDPVMHRLVREFLIVNYDGGVETKRVLVALLSAAYLSVNEMFAASNTSKTDDKEEAAGDPSQKKVDLQKNPPADRKAVLPWVSEAEVRKILRMDNDDVQARLDSYEAEMPELFPDLMRFLRREFLLVGQGSFLVATIVELVAALKLADFNELVAKGSGKTSVFAEPTFAEFKALADKVMEDGDEGAVIQAFLKRIEEENSNLLILIGSLAKLTEDSDWVSIIHMVGTVLYVAFSDAAERSVATVG